MRTPRIFITACLLMGLLLILFSIGAAAAQDEASQMGWNIVSNTLVDGAPNIDVGGVAFAAANNGTYIRLTGGGTFGPAMSDPVTGGGDWTVFGVNNVMAANGTYTVTGLLHWEVAPGSWPEVIQNNIAALADMRAGMATFGVEYMNEDGSAAGTGVLIVSCFAPIDSIETIFEGVIVSMGPTVYFEVALAMPGVNANRTSFYVVR